MTGFEPATECVQDTRSATLSLHQQLDAEPGVEPGKVQLMRLKSAP